jgi:hypothetical protein
VCIILRSCTLSIDIWLVLGCIYEVRLHQLVNDNECFTLGLNKILVHLKLHKQAQNESGNTSN